MQTQEKPLFKLEIDETQWNIEDEVPEEEAIQTVEFEILPPVDFTDKRRVEIYKEIADIDEKLNFINARVDKLNSEIDSLTNHADGIDYAIAVVSGVIAGLVDSFFVGETDIDKEKIQKMLEKKYHTANDNGFTHKQKGNDKHQIDSAMYHRLDDLAHHPTLLGLVASILVRYLRLVVFIDGTDGKPHIFFADTSSPEVTKKEMKQLFCAWAGAVIGGLCLWLAHVAEKKYEDNYDEEMPAPLKKMIKAIGATPMLIEILKAADTWIGHMMSDVSTSQGIPGIILSFLKEISVLPGVRNTNFPVIVDGLYNKGEHNLFEWGGVVFTATKKQAIPVLINEALVRGFYFVRHLIEEFKENKTVDKINWNRAIPFKNRTVVRMLTIATGTFTAFDIADAAIRSGGFNGACLLRINFVGVGRFVVAIGIDIGMGVKKRKKENERTKLRGEQIELLNAKLFYKEADMWIEAENTDKALQEVYVVMDTTVVEFAAAWAEIQQGSEDRKQAIDKIKETDSDFVDELAKLTEWGI